MSIEAINGPLVTFNAATPAPSPSSGIGLAGDSNPDSAPSLFFQGLGILDPRYIYTYQPGGSLNFGGSPAVGWGPGVTAIPVLDVVPATLTAGAVAAAANVTSGTAMTLVSTTANGVTVGASVVNALTGVKVTGLLAIGGAAGTVSFGQSGAIQFWDPTKALARAISITGVSGGAGGAFKIAGFDVYGFPMNETITAAAGAATTNGKKAWKYITSVTPQFTDAHNYSVDTTDIIGFPLRVDEWPYVEVFDGAATPTLVTSATGFVAAVTTTASATTGDVRGTYALQSASDGTKRVVLFVTPSTANIGSTAGLVGVAQF